MTTFDKLSKLEQTKQEIKNAIEDKGVNVGGAKFAEYPDKIEEIEEGVNIQDGIVWTEFDSNGFPSKAEHYSSSGRIRDYELNAISLSHGDTGYISGATRREVNLNNEVTEIGNYGASACRFTGIRLNLTELGEGALLSSEIEAEYIENVNFGPGSTHSLAFSTITGDVELTSTASHLMDRASIHGKLTVNSMSVDVDAFAFTTMDDLEIGDNVIELNGGAFQYAKIGEDGSYDLILPDDMTMIGYVGWAFENSNIGTVESQEKLQLNGGNAGYRMFGSCKFLRSANMKGGGEEFSRVFFNSTALTTVTLGSPGHRVGNITSDNFQYCDSLTDITLYVDSPSEGLPGAPWGATNATIHYEQA